MKGFKSFLKEAKDKDITIVALTKSDNFHINETVENMMKSAKKVGVKFFPIFTNSAYVSSEDYEKNTITVNNIDGKEKEITLDIDDTVCFVRGGAITDQAGRGLITIFQERGMFVINDIRKMDDMTNKYTASLKFQMNEIPSPRTSFVQNTDSIDTALESIGGEFPVIIKTVTGAEGIGVSKVESYDSLKSVLQSLWKYNAEVIIQEYKEIKYDVRTVVLDGKIVASTKRVKTKDSGFRTNKAQGAETVPHKLSKEEIDIVLKTASVFGGYYVGVDHVINNGEIFVLEVNGSPGSGSAYTEYYSKKKGGVISGKQLINYVIKYVTDKTKWKPTYGEIGKVETISIEQIGELDAKLDTGNGTYNVLHAEDIEKIGNQVSFKTVDGKTFKKDIVDTNKIKVQKDAEKGDPDRSEQRLVVYFDIEFNNKKYSDVPFSLDNRKGMTYPVLIGTHFLKTIKKSVNVNTRFTT